MPRRPRPLPALLTLLIALVPLVAAPASGQDAAAEPPEDVVFASFADIPTARPGQVVEVSGVLGTGQLGEAVPAPLDEVVALRLEGPAGQRIDLGQVTPAADGTFATTVPAAATQDLAPGTERNGYRETWAVRATTLDGSAVAGAGAVTFAQEAGVQLDYDFTSSVGWVKPGEAYPARVILTNFSSVPVTDQVLTIAPVDGTTVEAVRASVGTPEVDAEGAVTWTVPELAAAGDAGPARAVMVVESVAATTDQDPTIVWKDLSATAVLVDQQVTSHGPKVIPPDESFDTARYGDRPFPVVPVDFRDFSHLEANEATELDRIINDPAFEGSTFNLFQEMSYGQLYPDGAVPSAGIETADFSYEGSDGEGFDFHTAPTPPPSTCTGVHTPEPAGSPLYPERIVDGWYQLPGDQRYYGSDSGGTALAPALGVPVPASIDNGCGDTGKAVYDAAAIADPEIDYNQFDTDKDGVVDFFMMIFVGCGGNGVSQLAVAAECTNYPTGAPAPYDNIWPHSSTLEGGFRDPETGLLGYVSDDRLTDLEGNLLFYTDATHTVTTTDETDFPAYVRVGPYNVNPETVFDAASVISHEYGHSLGLPDFYSNAGLDLYGEWNLMASDFSQHMDAYGRQELGWVVPTEVPAGATTVEMVGSKTDINRIEWQTPAGEPYVLEGEDVHNGQMFRAGLPSRILVDPELVENGASPSHVYWSTSGNDYACPTSPNARALDIRLPQLADLEEGTAVDLSFASMFDIEWDYDYAFVMVTTDNGETYSALPSEAGFTTPATTNPNNNVCQATHGNGITGTTQSYEDGTAEIDRLLGSYPPNDGFATDSYDLTEFAGQEDVVIRFGYVTDVGLAHPGWFIDDVAVTADGSELYATDFEGGPGGPLIFNGGCQSDSGLGTAPLCAKEFMYVSAADGSPADHAYYLELRDRSGFDLDGYGQSDRGEISWVPGLSIGYTDEAFSYGNVSNGDRPGQHILDAVPEPGSDSPDLTDAAWNADEAFSDSGEGHVDNYSDPAREDGLFRFDHDCLTVTVLDMAGDELDEERAEDLTATVELTRGAGCADRDYGYEDGLGVTRLAGPGRVQTAVAVSEETHPQGADTAVIARAGDYPDALAAAPLAAAVDAPVLLTDTGSLAPEVEAELERLGVGTVYLLGGEQALSAEVEASLDGYEVTRLAGEGRVQTAAAVARELASVVDGIDSAVIARSDGFADALAAANLAVPGGDPILLSGTGGLDADTRAVMDELLAEGATVYLAGGTAALSEQVQSDVTAAGYTAKRLAGGSRYATAVAITDEALSRSDVPFSTATLASGTDFPDALAAGPAAAQLGGLLVLVDPADLAASPESRDLLAANAGGLRHLYVAGGTAAVSEDLVAQVLAALAE